MIPSPIHTVLSLMRVQAVQHLLMGGQACVLYGAAEFSRDTDLAVVTEPENLARLRRALDQLGAHVIAVPPFEATYLERGHAVHFQCDREDVRGIRIDVMARMRGVDPFPALWERRTTMELADAPDDSAATLTVDLLSLPDLVAAKKTQRDKHWPMIRRLVEANYLMFREQATAPRVQFWLSELRTPELLTAVSWSIGSFAKRCAPRTWRSSCNGRGRSIPTRSPGPSPTTARSSSRKTSRNDPATGPVPALRFPSAGCLLENGA